MRTYNFFIALTSVAVGSSLAGCASSQLNYNTLDIASTTDSLLTKQILYNFAAFLDSEAAIPAQVTVSSGNATTSNSITPTLSTPFDTGLSVTRTIVTAAAASTTNTNTSSVASGTAGLSASDSWNQSWAYAPVTDPDRLKRLQALYRYAVEWSDLREVGVRKFVANFPLVPKTVSYNTPICLRDMSSSVEKGSKAPLPSNSQLELDKKTGEPKGADAPIKVCVTAVGSNSGPSHGATTQTFSTLVPDEHYLKGPTCIVCSYGRGLTLNARLQGSWLHWNDLSGRPVEPTRAPRSGDISLGRSGHYEFFASPSSAQRFVDFTVAVLSATNIGGSGGPSAGGGSAGQASSGPKAFIATDSAGNPVQFFIP